jgi:hypothetical protein
MCGDHTGEHHVDDVDVAHGVGLAFDHELQVTPTPLIDFADTAFLRRPTAPLADVTYDSLIGEDQSERGGARRRLVRFGAAGHRLTVSIDSHELTLFVDPAAHGTCTVETMTSTERLAVDAEGAAAIRIDALPVRVHVDLDDDSFVTPWIVG